MAILIQSVVSIDPVQARAFTTTRDDSGFSTPVMTVSGYTDRDRTDLAAAKETARQLNELANNYATRTVYVADSEDSQYDGLYELTGATVTATPTTSNSTAALFALSVTLRRVGGGGTASSNQTRTLYVSPFLTANSWAITSTPWYAIPVGAVPLTVSVAQTLPTSDGTQSLFQSSTAQQYVLSGADVNLGECKVWDTGGSATRSTWKRVWSADHAFASPAHCAIDNGLITLTPVAGTPGAHTVDVWGTASAWVSVTGSGGATVAMASVGFTSWAAAEIVDLSNWGVTVRWRLTHSNGVLLPTKTVTIERGRAVATIVVTSAFAVEIGMAVLDLDFAFTRYATGNTQDMKDNGVDTAAHTFTMTDEPWLAGIDSGGQAMALLGATSTTSHTYTKIATTGGMSISKASATSATFYLGGIQYDSTRLRAQAESDFYGGGGALASIAGAGPGGSNNCASLPTAAAFVYFQTLTSPPQATRARAYFRVQNVGISAADTLRITIRNTTAAADANLDVTFAALGTSGTWKWVSHEVTTWNGTDALEPRATRQAAGGGGSLYVDQCVFVSLGTANYRYARDIGRAALTNTLAWQAVNRSVM